ncbi:MAG: hypothetical protein D5R99_03350 [Methanocalculus sp. MSAO_Arc1]|uniref:cache domain-containing protein n=1 Tax=Methanocalculus TaxID=71151 RepID=UPI000FEDAC6A|nr:MULTISPECIES: cache domain-containing protein [unclassified Methanocalculus]MCP1661516.1 hypothetical protein [Methanocalculus sp. AMF5]RQD81001.1 MAG: hypothetical protein D5R99_03350 [Methanocalculus sp. MSAO_Arc1]
MQSLQILFIGIAALLAGVAIGLIAAPAPDTDDEAARVLLELQSEITASLHTLDTRLAAAAYDLGATGLDTDPAREILLETSTIHPSVIDSTTVGPDGIIRAAEPPAYHDVEGTDVSDQLATQHILATHRPIMSRILPVAEGIDASFISAPVFTREGIADEPPGMFIGFTSVVFRPDLLIGEAALPVVAGTPYTICVVDTDGRVIYDTDPDQIGLPLDDPIYTAYPELVAFVTRVTEERQGKGSYTFRGETKESIWTTVSLYGTEWRVAVNRIAD